MSLPSTEDQDRADMARLVAGRDAALDDLMERHQLRLFQYLVRSLQNEEEAEDLAQETFVRVYQHRKSFDPRLKFSTWLYSIASNLVRTRYRWRERHPQVSIEAEHESTGASIGDVLPDRQPFPDEALKREELGKEVRHAISLLPENLRTPLLLAEYENLSYAEIAEVLNCTAKAVDNRITRARHILREKLRHTFAQNA